MNFKLVLNEFLNNNKFLRKQKRLESKPIPYNSKGEDCQLRILELEIKKVKAKIKKVKIKIEKAEVKAKKAKSKLKILKLQKK